MGDGRASGLHLQVRGWPAGKCCFVLRGPQRSFASSPGASEGEFCIFLRSEACCEVRFAFSCEAAAGCSAPGPAEACSWPWHTEGVGSGCRDSLCCPVMSAKAGIPGTSPPLASPSVTPGPLGPEGFPGAVSSSGGAWPRSLRPEGTGGAWTLCNAVHFVTLMGL